jgi:hypothetical protein
VALAERPPRSSASWGTPTAYFQSPSNRLPAKRVRAGDALEFEAAHYSFPVKADYSVSGPNLISVLMGKDRRYRLAWKTGVSRYVLSKETLVPEPGSVPFTGFHSGETFSVVVGYEDSNESKPSTVTIKMLWGCLATAR